MPSSPENEAGNPPAPDTAAPEQRRDDGQERLDATQDEFNAELARLEDRYKRALADLDNFRKRASRETERRVAEARESVLLDWLQAVDSVERAIRMEPDGPCADGLRAVLEQMDSILMRSGVVRIGAAGERFDPGRHEAVAVATSTDVPDSTILAVERSGFAVGDRVIRPAEVVVARTPERAR
jgi:molecular chaperone GrpE